MIYVLAGVVMFAGLFVYVMFMIFLPEWVGITGNTALNIQKEHQGDGSPEAAPERVPETGPEPE